MVKALTRLSYGIIGSYSLCGGSQEKAISRQNKKQKNMGEWSERTGCNGHGCVCVSTREALWMVQQPFVNVWEEKQIREILFCSRTKLKELINRMKYNKLTFAEPIAQSRTICTCGVWHVVDFVDLMMCSNTV